MFTPWIVVVVVTVHLVSGSTQDKNVPIETKKYPLYEMCTKRMTMDAAFTVMKLNVIKLELFGPQAEKVTVKDVRCEKMRSIYREARK